MSKTRKTTMSVPEMRQLLGIGKTDSYWLVHKQCFETILVEGKMRVVIDSFEHWYANQIKYKKVDGTPPGEELRSNSYSPPEIAEMLGLCESVIYDIIKRYDIETFQADYWTRVRKDVFEAWYKSQTKYRTKEDRERDAELEAASMTIVQRSNRYNVVYLYDDEATGKRKQKWESFSTLEDAKRRKAEVEYRQELGNVVIQQCDTLDDLLKEYVSIYGKSIWSLSVYSGNIGLINNYISPILGSMKLKDVTARVLEKYYMQLLKTPAVVQHSHQQKAKKPTCVAPPTVRKVHNILRSAFHQAVKWELMEKNPAMYATVPKAETKKREIWDAPTLFRATELCEDERLKLSINLSFACSLRIGELLGLTWDCVDISPESIAAGKASIFVNKELQRVSKSAMQTLEKKDVILVSAIF